MKARQLWVSLALSAICACSAAPATETRTLQRQMPSLVRATAWLGSQPLGAAELRGKVVLVDFWTYTCINWLRTAPYVRAWAEKYKDHGLVVIGVHTPEFSFESDLDNVRRAVSELRVNYPVAVDNSYSIWRAFNNHYWPALYFVDVRGRIRHQQFGEGDYAQAEQIIQQLLVEAGHTGFDRTPVSVEGIGAEASPDWRNLRSPETYFGRARGERFVSRDSGLLKLNQWTLVGQWTRTAESALLNKANGKLAHRFHARDLHLVMGTATQGTSVRFRVSIDGQPPGAVHGVDVDESGNGVIETPRMYQLIRQTAPVSDRLFEIEFLDGDVELFAFTFG